MTLANTLGVVIMAGGKGVRLRPLTYAVPKPLLPVDGVPILLHTLTQVRALGVERCHISIGYMREFIRNFIGDEKKGLQVSYIEEGEPRGTIGALGAVPDLGDPTLIINGDLVFDGILPPLLEAHRKSQADITVGTKVHNVDIPYGVIHADEQGRLVALEEKPKISQDVACGMNVISARARALIPDGPFDMPQLYEAAVAQGMEVRVERLEGSIIEVGALAEYRDYLNASLANEPMLSGGDPED